MNGHQQLNMILPTETIVNIILFAGELSFYKALNISEADALLTYLPTILAVFEAVRGNNFNVDKLSRYVIENMPLWHISSHIWKPYKMAITQHYIMLLIKDGHFVMPLVVNGRAKKQNAQQKTFLC